MLAPNPFFSVMGKYVVHWLIWRIFGRMATASSVVNAGCTGVSAGLRVGPVGPAVRVSSRVWMRAIVPGTSMV